MMKEEIIQLHAFFLQVRHHIEDILDTKDSTLFSFYDQLQVYPHLVHKSRNKQLLATFELCKGIADCLVLNNFNEFEVTSEKLDCLCNKYRKKDQ